MSSPRSSRILNRITMKKIYILFIALAALMFASSCQKDEGGLKPQMRKITVKAKMAAETKVALSGAQPQWENGDEIALVFPHESQSQASHVCALTTEIDELAAQAKFKGSLDKSVTTGNGYKAEGFAVYPRTAVDEENGTLVFSLPAEQIAAETVNNFASFHKGANLTSGIVSLKKLVAVGVTDSYFKNACAVLRFTLAEEVASMTLTGTSNLAGQAPLLLDLDGRLVIDSEADWSDDAKSVTLKPSNGDTFENGTLYNLLVWPGSHTALTLTVNYKGYGDVTKTTNLNAEFKASKYYTLNFDASAEVLLEELDGALDETVGGLTEFEGKLEAAESDVNALLAQVQSVTLMTEYLDNSVYAPYGVFSVGGLKPQPISLDYLVKPSTAAKALVEAFKLDNSIVSGLVGYTKSNGFEVADNDLPVTNLVLTEVDGVGSIVTATVDMTGVSKDFYEGKFGASVALYVHSEEAKLDIHSEFANLIPQNGTVFSCSYITNVPAIKGAQVSIPYTFTLADPSISPVTVTATGENVESTYATVNKASMSGNLTIAFSESHPLEEQKVTLELTVGTEVITKEFTFVDSGAYFEINDPGQIDYVGGDIIVGVTATGIKSFDLTASGTGISNTATLFTFEENTGGARTMTIGCNATIPSTSLTYYKSITVTQKQYGAQLTSKYYSNGDRIPLNNATASCSHYFNLVILGDGFTKKDLIEGGKFEQRARSAMDSFFGIEPYRSFKDRFNVLAVTFESNESGTDITDANTYRDTYFDSHGQNGSTGLSASRDKVIGVVKNTLGFSSDDTYYRTIVILLVNTDLNSGSTVYAEPDRISKPGFVNGYASFAFACVAANSSGTNGLIKHEAGGHAFGRLADEYVLDAYKNTTADSAKKAELDNWHTKGWYWNVTHNPSAGYYNFTNKFNTYPGVAYIEGAWNVAYGIYRPAEGGMMLTNSGNFNPVSRHAIYHRIITESEGVSAYSWEKFSQYDAINR